MLLSQNFFTSSRGMRNLTSKSEYRIWNLFVRCFTIVQHDASINIALEEPQTDSLKGYLGKADLYEGRKMAADQLLPSSVDAAS